MFLLNGVQIKNPTNFDVEPYTITKSTRVANGDMVMDFVANKLKFNFGYAAIDSQALNTILDILWAQLAITKQCFVTFEYPYNGVQKTAQVYAGSIPHKLHRGDSSLWVWKDVSFSLIQK